MTIWFKNGFENSRKTLFNRNKRCKAKQYNYQGKIFNDFFFFLRPNAMNTIRNGALMIKIDLERWKWHWKCKSFSKLWKKKYRVTWWPLRKVGHQYISFWYFLSDNNENRTLEITWEWCVWVSTAICMNNEKFMHWPTFYVLEKSPKNGQPIFIVNFMASGYKWEHSATKNKTNSIGYLFPSSPKNLT